MDYFEWYLNLEITLPDHILDHLKTEFINSETEDLYEFIQDNDNLADVIMEVSAEAVEEIAKAILEHKIGLKLIQNKTNSD